MNFRLKITIAVLSLAIAFPQTSFSFTIPTGGPSDDWDEMDCTKNVRFPPHIKKRLDGIYHRIYMDYVDLIETYAWAGALTTPQKQIRMKMLRNYVETFKKRNYRWCSEHESDEWEEEWYNND